MPVHATKIIYRMVPAMRLLRGRHPTTRTHTSAGLVRLTATRMHRAVTLLIDWDSAVDQGWPRLQTPSLPLPRQFRRPGTRRYAGFPWFHGKFN
ncbi:hypothetical protein [Cupriavidus necator]|uniref:hypothetical protein n=1 Tax=Cupriavidus necator TaxID=106590 RepID=UPI0005B3FCD7|nr:hypothetical protein [Cupriavidus necator]